MASSENILLKRLSGHIGRQLIIKQYGDKTIVSKYPDMSKRKLSAKQRRVNKIMEEANLNAKTVIADHDLRNAALLRLNITRNKLYNSLIKEYFQNHLAGSGQ